MDESDKDHGVLRGQGYEIGLLHAWNMIIRELKDTKNETAKKSLSLVATKIEKRCLKLFKREPHPVSSIPDSIPFNNFTS